MAKPPRYLNPAQIQTTPQQDLRAGVVESTPLQFKPTNPTEPSAIAAMAPMLSTLGHFGKKKRGGTKMTNESEKTENKEWDTGFGELYEKIDDRKVKAWVPTLSQINGWKGKE